VFTITRDQLAIGLAAENVDTRKYYDPPVHRHAAYRRYSIDTQLPNTDHLAERSLSLPIWSDMDDDTALGICRAVYRVCEQATAT
jgi:dTDP-4-amino-4,6-dideoxygalactose transaminase